MNKIQGQKRHIDLTDARYLRVLLILHRLNVISYGDHFLLDLYIDFVERKNKYVI